MVLCNEVTKLAKDDISAPPSEGVYVYGLYLEGAGWDKRNMKLIESKPKVLFELMPVIRIYAENNSKLSCIFWEGWCYIIDWHYKYTVLWLLSSNRYFTHLSTGSIFMPKLNDYLLISRPFVLCYYRDIVMVFLVKQIKYTWILTEPS